jgi:hypothetical protein
MAGITTHFPVISKSGLGELELEDVTLMTAALLAAVDFIDDLVKGPVPPPPYPTEYVCRSVSCMLGRMSDNGHPRGPPQRATHRETCERWCQTNGGDGALSSTSYL